MATKSLFGDIVEIKPEKETVRKIKSKIAKPKQVSATAIVKSKTYTIEEKLDAIYKEVDRILGVYKEDTVVLDNIISFVNYINECIKNKIIVIDTETNNSLDPLTCKLMGPCLYTPGQKNAYIPVNHTDLNNVKLSGQITEEQIREQFERINNSDCKIIFHNAKFDYKVIYCTCGIKLRIDWDTLVGARMLDENERAGLKIQYITKIDPTIEKYSIEHLFNIPYQNVNPNVFALYAATDSFMTYKMYLYQLLEFNRPENRKIYNLFKTVEMPIVTVSAEMELAGVCIDEEYAKRLSVKYHNRLEKIEEELSIELNKLKSTINNWRVSADAVMRPKEYCKAKNPSVEELKKYPLVDEKGYYKEKKSKGEQLSDPVETTSPTQLAILLYDILKAPIIDKENPRGTGTEILEKLAERFPIAGLIVEQRTTLKLLDAFIDSLPQLLSPRDNRIHANFNQLGTVTGRFACTEPNLQQIPSKNNEIRLMFKASENIELIEVENNIIVKYYQDLETPDGWKRANKLEIGDIILNEDQEPITIKMINTNKDNIIIFI